MSKFNSSSMMSFTIHLSFSLTTQTTEWIFIVSFFSERDPPVFCFPSRLCFPQHVFCQSPPQHWSLDAALTDALRIAKLRLTILDACGTLTSFISTDKSWAPVRLNILHLRGFGNTKRRLHVQTGHERSLVPEESWYPFVPAIFLPFSMPL